jgi:hypothetical protein
MYISCVADPTSRSTARDPDTLISEDNEQEPSGLQLIFSRNLEFSDYNMSDCARGSVPRVEVELVFC